MMTLKCQFFFLQKHMKHTCSHTFISYRCHSQISNEKEKKQTTLPLTETSSDTTVSAVPASKSNGGSRHPDKYVLNQVHCGETKADEPSKGCRRQNKHPQSLATISAFNSPCNEQHEMHLQRGRISQPKRMTSFSFRVMYFWSGILTSLTNVCREEAQVWFLTHGTCSSAEGIASAQGAPQSFEELSSLQSISMELPWAGLSTPNVLQSQVLFSPIANEALVPDLKM